MAKKQRIIRKTSVTSDTAFDDRLWPVNLALVVFGGYLAGVIVAIFPLDISFQLNRLHINGLLYLGIVAALIPAAMVGLSFVNNRMVRRGLQLAAVLSLICQLTAFVLMMKFGVLPEFNFKDPPTDDPVARKKMSVLPDYNPSQVDPAKWPKQDFQKPVETEIPDPKKEEVKQKKPEPEEPKVEKKPTETPEPQKTIDPHTIERKKFAESPPRRSEQKSKLSRQMAKADLRPTKAVAVENVPTQAKKRPTKIEAKTARVERKATPAAKVEIKQRVTEAEATTKVTHQKMQLTRRQTEQNPVARAAAKPMPQKKVIKPVDIPRVTAMAARVEATAPKSQVNPLKAASAVASKQATKALQPMARSTPDPSPQPVTKVTPKATVRQQPSEKMPTLAKTIQPRSTPRRQARALPQPSMMNAVASATPTKAPSRPSR